mmetsp:Transcript_10554/g.14570  ORF Transcript_10554/g.14570 Transcript_10554/m.14570 type:complete len:218 (-) Transcript_10554:1568-2221(-)
MYTVERVNSRTVRRENELVRHHAGMGSSREPVWDSSCSKDDRPSAACSHALATAEEGDCSQLLNDIAGMWCRKWSTVDSAESCEKDPPLLASGAARVLRGGPAGGLWTPQDSDSSDALTGRGPIRLFRPPPPSPLLPLPGETDSASWSVSPPAAVVRCNMLPVSLFVPFTDWDSARIMLAYTSSSPPCCVCFCGGRGADMSQQSAAAAFTGGTTAVS